MDQLIITPPVILDKVNKKGRESGFDMASDIKAGWLLRTLVASKPGGRFLELGTGIGASLCWMLDGMDGESTLVSVDNDQELISFSDQLFGNDPRLTLVCKDGKEWINDYQGPGFDLVFADAWPGKYSCLEKTLALVRVGGFYVIDDMLPQPNWPDGHAEKAEKLTQHLAGRTDLIVSMIQWSTGIILATKAG